MQTEMGVDDLNDGIFFMRFSDFDKYFKDFQVCYYHDDYKLCSFPYETPKDKERVTKGGIKLATTRRRAIQELNFKFDIRETGDYYFSINQINKRSFPPSERYKYSKATIELIRFDHSEKTWHWVGNCSNSDKEYWFKAECLPGTYYIRLIVEWASFVNKICWTTYGPREIMVTQIDDDVI